MGIPESSIPSDTTSALGAGVEGEGVEGEGGIPAGGGGIPAGGGGIPAGGGGGPPAGGGGIPAGGGGGPPAGGGGISDFEPDIVPFTAVTLAASVAFCRRIEERRRSRDLVAFLCGGVIVVFFPDTLVAAGGGGTMDESTRLPFRGRPSSLAAGGGVPCGGGGTATDGLCEGGGGKPEGGRGDDDCDGSREGGGGKPEGGLMDDTDAPRESPGGGPSGGGGIETEFGRPSDKVGRLSLAKSLAKAAKDGPRFIEDARRPSTEVDGLPLGGGGRGPECDVRRPTLLDGDR